MTPTEVRTLADRIAKDPRLGRTARTVTASILEAAAAQRAAGQVMFALDAQEPHA